MANTVTASKVREACLQRTADTLVLYVLYLDFPHKTRQIVWILLSFNYFKCGFKTVLWLSSQKILGTWETASMPSSEILLLIFLKLTNITYYSIFVICTKAKTGFYLDIWVATVRPAVLRESAIILTMKILSSLSAVSSPWAFLEAWKKRTFFFSF